VDGEFRKGLNSLVILGALSIWKHRNCLVFYGMLPNLAEGLLLTREEIHLWGMASARGISYLVATTLRVS